MVEHLTDTPKNKGSNLATGSRTEKKAKKWRLSGGLLCLYYKH